MLLIIEIAAALFETILVFILAQGLFESKPILCRPFYYGGFFLCNLLLSLFVSSSTIRLILLTVLLTLFVFLFYYSKLWQAVGFAVLFSSIAIAVDLLCMGLLYLFHLNNTQLMSDPQHRAIFIILAKTMQLSVIFLIASRGVHGLFEMPFLRILPLLLCQGFSIFVCIVLWETTMKIAAPHSVFLAISLIGLLYINIILYVYLIYIKSGYDAAQKKAIAEQQLQTQIEYYQIMLEEQERTRSMWHDIKKQINTVSALVRADQPQAAATLNELNQQFSGLGDFVRLDNAVISAILDRGIREARTKGIKIKLEGSAAADLNISPLDLSVIIGNTLDNAIQACENIKDPKATRSITILFRQNDSLLLYEISNTYDPLFVPHRDPSIHGYGLKNVQRCVEKNSGFYNVTKVNDTYIVSITLNV